MTVHGHVVLQQEEIQRALKRIAYEIIEASKGSSDLVLLGIPTRGSILAKRLALALNSIQPDCAAYGALDVTMYRDDLGKHPTRATHPTTIPEGGVDGKTVILVDDVLMSGRTIRAALDALNAIGRPKAVRLAVLIDRGHRELPIRPDFVGKNLPTATSERIHVRLEEIDAFEEVTIL